LRKRRVAVVEYYARACRTPWNFSKIHGASFLWLMGRKTYASRSGPKPSALAR